MGGLFTVCPHRALALLSDGGSSWSALGLGLSLPPWALVAVGEAGELRNGDGLGVELEAVSGGPLWFCHVPPSPFGWVSPTGMTEHTKNLLRAFYELSQTHRGKGTPRCAV